MKDFFCGKTDLPCTRFNAIMQISL